MNRSENRCEVRPRRGAFENPVGMLVLMALSVIVYVGVMSIGYGVLGRPLEDFWARTLETIWIPLTGLPGVMVTSGGSCGCRALFSRRARGGEG